MIVHTIYIYHDPQLLSIFHKYWPKEIRDTAQMYADWDRQVRYKNEKAIGMKPAEVNTEKGKINSVKMNMEY